MFIAKRTFQLICASLSVVIPGPRVQRGSPESITTACDYGFSGSRRRRAPE